MQRLVQVDQADVWSQLDPGRSNNISKKRRKFPDVVDLTRI